MSRSSEMLMRAPAPREILQLVELLRASACRISRNLKGRDRCSSDNSQGFLSITCIFVQSRVN